MRTIALLGLCLSLLVVSEPSEVALARGTASFTEKSFQKLFGTKAFTVRVRATRRVRAEFLALLEKELTILPVSTTNPEQLAFWRDRPMPLISTRAELQIELTPADANVDSSGFTYSWPDPFRISRPGVLELRPEEENLFPRNAGVGVINQALGSAERLKGRLLCSDGTSVRHVSLVAGGQKTQTKDDGTFEIAGPFPSAPSAVYVAYDAKLALPLFPNFNPRLQIMNDFHDTRNESVTQKPSIDASNIADFGDVKLSGSDCILWELGLRALVHYFQVMHEPPPAGGLRVKRWEAVYISAGTGAHTFYDYLVLPTDQAIQAIPDREHTFFHEFGHTIRFVADGSKTHWDWDNFRFNFGHKHNTDEVFNKGFAFSEGWAQYWAHAVNGSTVTPGPAGSLDWNEGLIGARLADMAFKSSDEFMIKVQLANPETIHTMYEFEKRYCAAIAPKPNRYCKDGNPDRDAPASCPPDYTDDGATCRLNNILTKPSTTRGVGIAPNSCGPGREYNGSLCYPVCPDGYHGAGPVCWQNCPAGYADDGATCRRDAHIIGSDNGACPWYDKCGRTFAGGCSVCPIGYHNDGCTCRIDVDIFGKSSKTRGAGTVPSGCSAQRQYDTGLCYQPCPAGYHGVGPVCWGPCPADYDDHGGTCYRAPRVFSND